MGPKKLAELRRQAEKAISDMPNGELKVKAFEVILHHLLHGAGAGGHDRPRLTQDLDPVVEKKIAKRASVAKSKTERILAIRNQNFFQELKSIGEIQGELAAHGWHYPLTALSGPLQELVRRGELRRQKMQQGNKKVWKYCNP